MSTQPLARRPGHAAAQQRSSSPLIDLQEAAARCRRIRNGWSDLERHRRAYTARVVQLLLIGPPVGFRLQAE